MLSNTIRSQHRNIVEIPVELVIIETKTDDEMIGDFETSVLDGHLYYAPRFAIEESTDGERIGATAGKRLQ